MTLAFPHVERDVIKDRVTDTIHLRPIAYREGGSLLRNATGFEDGDVSWPHVLTRAPLMVYTAPDGMRRICPTRDPVRYMEIGAPYIKAGGSFVKPNMGNASRQGGRIVWMTDQANLYIVHGGHFVKLAIWLKNGWAPQDGQFAFPVGIRGLTRQGGHILADGQVVARLQAPHVEDWDNPDDVRSVGWDFVHLGGQTYILFTLPSLAGMSKPVVDPTLTLQPDAAAGVDVYIQSGQPTTNYGASTAFNLGESSAGSSANRGLIKFDLSGLPGTAAISSATLSLWLTSNGNYRASNNRTCRVFRQKRAWVESQATWNIYSTGNNWQTAGGFGANDCEQTDIGTCAFATTDLAGDEKQFSLTPTTKVGLDLTNGWLVKIDTENNDAYLCASSDHATPGYRPKLVIVYTLPVGSNLRTPGWGRW